MVNINTAGGLLNCIKAFDVVNHDILYRNYTVMVSELRSTSALGWRIRFAVDGLLFSKIASDWLVAWSVPDLTTSTFCDMQLFISANFTFSHTESHIFYLHLYPFMCLWICYFLYPVPVADVFVSFRTQTPPPCHWVYTISVLYYIMSFTVPHYMHGAAYIVL